MRLGPFVSFQLGCESLAFSRLAGGKPLLSRLRYGRNADADAGTGQQQLYVVDYFIADTGLALEPADPFSPMLLRSCALGQL